MVHWGMMPRMMRQDGTHAGLTERYMRMFVAGLLANVGINTSRGTILVVENGTAAIRAHMEQVLLDLFDGAVKVHRSGMEGKTQALLRGYEGRQGGNPRGKAHLESVWNLTANIWSSCLPAPSGHDRTEPEWLAGLMKEQKALLKKQGYLEIRDPDRAATLRHLMPTFEQLTTDIAWRVYDAFNDRTDHALEGWERMGLVVPMVRLSTDGDWITLTDSIPEADRHTLLNMAARDPERLVSSRRLSPAEAWNLKLQHQPPLRKATQWEIVDLLSRDLAVKTVVKGSYIVLQNKAVSMDRLYYPASIVTPEGYQRILPSGMDVWVMLNMFDDQHLYIIDGKGRCLGMSTLQQRVPYYDEDQVRAAMGRKKKATAAALQETRVHHARKEAAIVGTRLYNRQVAKGAPITVQGLLNAEGTDAAALAAVKKLPGISLLPETEIPETASPQKESHPKISFYKYYGQNNIYKKRQRPAALFSRRYQRAIPPGNEADTSLAYLLRRRTQLDPGRYGSPGRSVCQDDALHTKRHLRSQCGTASAGPGRTPRPANCRSGGRRFAICGNKTCPLYDGSCRIYTALPLRGGDDRTDAVGQDRSREGVRPEASGQGGAGALPRVSQSYAAALPDCQADRSGNDAETGRYDRPHPALPDP